MRGLILFTIIIFIFNCASTTLSERVKIILGDLSTFSDEKILGLYERADSKIEYAKEYLENLDKIKKKETEVMLEGYVPSQERATDQRRETALRALEEWTEAKVQILAELKKRNLSPLIDWIHI